MIKTNEELQEILESVDKFNNFLEKFKQEIFLAIPQVVVKHIEDFHKLQKLNKKFYKDNPELEKERFLIGSLANQISAENPALDIEEVFDLTAIKAKRLLKERKDEAN